MRQKMRTTGHLRIQVRSKEDKTDPNADNFMIFAILHFYSFILVINTTVQNDDNEISLHFKPMKLT